MDIPVERAGAFGNASLAQAAGGTIRLGQMAALLRRHAWLIVGLALIGGIAALAYAASLPKSYTSTAKLAVQGDQYAIPELQGAVRNANAPDPMPAVRTELQAMTSRSMVEQVVKELNLAADPQFNPALQPATLLGELKGALHSLLPHSKGGAPADADPDEGVLMAARSALTSFQDDRDLVIDVSFTAHNPALAARFVNTLVSDYLAARAKWRNAANEGAGADMTQRIAQVRGDLTGIEQKMHALRASSGVVDLRSGSVGQQQLEELATAADRAALERAQAEANYNRATAAANAGGSAALASVLDSPTISGLREQESTVSRQIADLASSHGPNYPGLRGARSDLAAVRAQIGGETHRIVAALGAQVQVARAHEADVKQQLAQAQVEASKSQNVVAQLSQLQADADAQRQVYRKLLEQAQQTSVQTGKPSADMPDVRLLSQGVPTAIPSAPNMKLAGGLGVVGGGVLGCLLAFVRIQREDGFADAEALTETGGLPVVVTLPRVPLRRRGRLLAQIAAHPGGAEAEALRLLRARLRGLGRAQPTRSVMFASADSGDGAEIAIAFARVAATDGERVLLVEGDLGDPSFGALLGVQGGFDGVLRGDEDWRDMIGVDSDTPLHLLPAAAPVSDGQSLLAGTALQNLLMEARDDYSLVVMTAPRASDASARTLAQRTDATVLVVDGRRARRAELREEAERLAALSRNPVLGVLVARS